MNSENENLFDWEAARQRINQVRAALNEDKETRPEVLQRVWAERAVKEADAGVDIEGGAQVELVVVRLGRELYGLEASYVFRIDEVGQIARVPHVPDWVAGVANVRGRILSMFDVQKFLGLEGDSVSSREEQNGKENGQHALYFIVVETPEMELGLLVDDILSVITLPQAQIREATDTVRGIPLEYVRGVVEDVQDRLDDVLDDARLNVKNAMLVVLDVRALLADDHLVIREEVG